MFDQYIKIERVYFHDESRQKVDNNNNNNNNNNK
jgi:hypothetical protein